MKAILVLTAAALLLGSGALGEGEIYTWTDARGGIHATRDLLEVPVGHRREARLRAAGSAPSRLQTFESNRPARQAEGLGAASAALMVPSAGSLRIPFQRQGTLMVVDVLLNGHVRAPFLVDTGASGISIPERVVRELGIRIDADTPRLPVQTAAGVISEPVIALESLQVGEARVDHLDALVNSSMDVGLLGGSFFNNFVYEVDAVAQQITLRSNDGVRGGLTSSQWRQRFEALRVDLVRLETYLAEGEMLRGSRRAEIEAHLDAVRQAMDGLHREANVAGVPRAWRD
jgi:clan AA aspartic protease (TIGR02281 family)